MNHLSETATQFIYPLGRAIVHSLWQGVGIFLLLKLALSLIPIRYSSARYYGAIGALGLLITAFIGTFMYEYYSMPVYVVNASYSPAATTLASGAQNHSAVATGHWWQQLQQFYNMHTTQVVVLYLLGIAIFFLRIGYNLLHIANLKTKNVSAPDSRWSGLLEQSVASLDIRKQVKLFFSSKVDVPMVMGVMKPVILVPIALSTQLSTEQAEAILLHELAHVKRNDFLINIIQMFVETILFYNPFVWLISGTIRKEREHCCDDAVVNASGAKLPYVKALAALETYRQMPVQPSLAAKGSKQHLLTRIKRIMEMRKNNINYSQLVAVMATIMLMIAAVTFITPNNVQAQTKKNEGGKKTEQADKQQKDKTAPANTTTGNKPATKANHDNKPVKPAPPTPEERIQAEALEAAGEGLAAAAEALEAIDFEDIISRAFESIKWDSLGNQIQMELDGVDWEEINDEIKEAMAEAREEMAEAREEMAEARREMRMNSKEKSKEIADAHKQIADANKQLAEAGQRIADARRLSSQAMAEARRAQASAMREANRAANGQTRVVSSRSHDHILKRMEKDGLIDLTKRYKVQKKGNELYINGTRQSDEVYKRYGKMFRHKNVTIKGSHNSITIKSDD